MSRRNHRPEVGSKRSASGACGPLRPSSASPDVIYRLIFWLVLQRMDAERAHALASRALAFIHGPLRLGGFLGVALRPRDPGLHIKALGHTFRSPLGAAAGVDKYASWFESLGALGFGFVEVGTITGRPQEANPRPRVARLLRERGLVNRLGFPNPGAEEASRRLARRTGELVVGANVGRSRETAPGGASDDYRRTVRGLAANSDYLVLNVSSPNTPGLAAMQEVGLLRELVGAVRAELRALDLMVPTLVKIGPDLSDTEIDDIADLALELKLDGIVATNTTLNRDGVTLATGSGFLLSGGISGRPLQSRALEVLERLYARVGNDLVLVSVGGIETAEDAWERVLAGATLLEAYTAFVYGGPLWPRSINAGLSRKLRASGAPSLQSLVGAGASARSRPASA